MKVRAFAAALLLSPLLCGCFYGKTEVLQKIEGTGLCPFESGTTYAAYSHDSTGDTPLGTFKFEDDNGTCSLRAAADVTSTGSTKLREILGATNKLITPGRYISFGNGSDESGYTQFWITDRYNDQSVEIRDHCETEAGGKLALPGIRQDDDKDCYVDTEAQLRTLLDKSADAGVTYIFKPMS